MKLAQLKVSNTDDLLEECLTRAGLWEESKDRLNEHASALSGGNQQKVVLARELARELRLLVASQPTRGLDVGSIEFVHEQIVATRDSGIPVLIVATELDEATQLGDRIAVMYRGKVVGVVPATTPRSVLGQMMAGISA